MDGDPSRLSRFRGAGAGAGRRRVGAVVAPGPEVLGRGVVLTVGDEVPPPWSECPVVTVDEAALGDPAAVVAELHEAWAARRPVVVMLGVEPARFRSPETWTDEPWVLGVDFEPWLDRLQFLVWANTYDARGGGPPIWWWARKAERLQAGAKATPEGPADISLADGKPAWVDGGPRTALAVAPAGGGDPAAATDPATDRAGGIDAATALNTVPATVIHAESVELGRLTPVPPPAPPAGPTAAMLAPDQLEAVAHAGGPARVIAPAGSGKTRVLTERLRHLMVDRAFEREGVLAVAYNKKAQEELEERCSSFRPRVQTLNALGYALLRESRGRAPRVLEEREVRHMLDELLPRRQRRANTDPMAPYLEGLSLIRLGLRDPEEVEEERDDVPGLAAAFGPYRRQLLAAGAVDFDDQVYAAIETLLRDGDFRRHAQDGCRHLLVDEFQDLTPAHVLLLRLLAVPGLDVFGVGDDDQVIYGHAGADPAFLVHFADRFPGAADHRLEVNYRCPVAVIDAARHLLSYNDVRVVKQIRPGPHSDDSAESLQVHRHAPEAGATALAEVVQGWLSGATAAGATEAGATEAGATAAGAPEPATPVSPDRIAVLTRVNSLLLAPHVALAEAGIPINSVLRPQVLERTGVRAALAYLRIGADPERVSGADVIEIYRRPSRGFPQWFTKWLRGYSSLEALRRIGDKIDDDKVAAKVDDLVDDLELVAKAVQGGTSRHALTVIKDRVGLGGAMGLLDSSATGEGGSSHLDDLEALEQVAALHPDPSTFEQWLRAVFHREAEPGGVTLSTVHRVKGMEWDHVAVFGVTAGIVPHRLALDEEEERRVLHVAITRGRHRVAVLADQSRPSPFLDEMAGTAPHRPKGWPVPARAGVGAADTDALARLGISGAGAAAADGAALVGTGLPGAGGGAGGRLPAAAARSRATAGRGATAVTRTPLEPPATSEIAQAEAALKAWRTDRSRRDKVPAFIVLNDRYLRAVATRRPQTLKELRTVDGIGPTKLELYGDEILAVLEGAGFSSAPEPAVPDL